MWASWCLFPLQKNTWKTIIRVLRTAPFSESSWKIRSHKTLKVFSQPPKMILRNFFFFYDMGFVIRTWSVELSKRQLIIAVGFYDDGTFGVGQGFVLRLLIGLPIAPGLCPARHWSEFPWICVENTNGRSCEISLRWFTGLEALFIFNRVMC